MKRPRHIYTIYVMTAAGQKRYRFGSVRGVTVFLRHRARYYRSPYCAAGFDAMFCLDGISLEQAGFVEVEGLCREKVCR